MPKFTATLYCETYTTVEVEAESQKEANALILAGNYDDDNILDVTVKESEIM